MVNLEITWQTIAAIVAMLLVVSNGVSVIVKWTNPYRKLKETVEQHEAKLAKDLVRLNGTEKADQMICKTLLALLDHEITGNGLDRLKAVKKEMQDYIVDR